MHSSAGGSPPSPRGKVSTRSETASSRLSPPPSTPTGGAAIRLARDLHDPAEEGLEGGFHTDAIEGSKVPLPVLYSERLEETLEAVESAGGTIVKPIFSFPGGRRFQFKDPAGNELAVWGE